MNYQYYSNGKYQYKPYDIIKGSSIRYASNYCEYLLDGEIYRENGPAIIYNDGSERKEWVIYNRRHKEDGPAVIWSGGGKEYWLDGNHYPKIKNDVQWLIEVQRVKRKQKEENI